MLVNGRRFIIFDSSLTTDVNNIPSALIERVAFVGDLIGGGPPFARDGYPFAWQRTPEMIAALDADTLVAGHGSIIRGPQVISDRLRFFEHALGVIRHGAANGWDAERIAADIDLDAFRRTFEPEPEHAPWAGWLRDLASRGLLELAGAED